MVQPELSISPHQLDSFARPFPSLSSPLLPFSLPLAPLCLFPPHSSIICPFPHSLPLPFPNLARGSGKRCKLPARPGGGQAARRRMHSRVFDIISRANQCCFNMSCQYVSVGVTHTHKCNWCVTPTDTYSGHDHLSVH